MSKIDLTTNRKPDLEIDEVRVLSINTINRARVKFLRKRKADHNDNGMVQLTCGHQTLSENLYIEDEDHAKRIMDALKIAIKLGWFKERL